MHTHDYLCKESIIIRYTCTIAAHITTDEIETDLVSCIAIPDNQFAILRCTHKISVCVWQGVGIKVSSIVS